MNDIGESTYRYIQFVKQERQPKKITDNYSCQTRAGGVEIGVVEWYRPWRQYCYFPTISAVYSKGCLCDIADFIGKLK